MAEDRVTDPYRFCEQRCSHDLGEGVLISELFGGDGPHPPGYMLVNLVARQEPARPQADLVAAARGGA